MQPLRAIRERARSLGPGRVDALIAVAFAIEGLLEAALLYPDAEYAWKSSSPAIGWIIRPFIGSASAMTWSTRPIRRNASSPRSEIARLIDRPRSTCATRGSGRRS